MEESPELSKKFGGRLKRRLSGRFWSRWSQSSRTIAKKVEGYDVFQRAGLHKGNHHKNTSDDAQLRSLENLEKSDSSSEEFYDANELSVDCSGSQEKEEASKKSILCIVIHGGNLLDDSENFNSKTDDLETLKRTLKVVMDSHYSPALKNRIHLKLVPCPKVSRESLDTLSSIRAHTGDTHGHPVKEIAEDYFSLGTIPLFFTSTQYYEEILSDLSYQMNSCYSQWLVSTDFTIDNPPRVCLIGDSTGSILAFDILSRVQSTNDVKSEQTMANNLTNHDRDSISLDFNVTSFFMLGSPLGLVLAYRNAKSGYSGGEHAASPKKPLCEKVYNLFHLTDPCSFRIEPLLHPLFRGIPPVRLLPYHRCPHADNYPITLAEAVNRYSSTPVDSSKSPQRLIPGSINNSGSGSQCQSSGYAESGAGVSEFGSKNSVESIRTTSSEKTDAISLTDVTCRWWGNQRIDFGIPSPQSLHSLPVGVLSPLLHASHWEALDSAAFMIRELISIDEPPSVGRTNNLPLETVRRSSIDDDFVPSRSREKWQHRGSSFKVKTMIANHRGNDVIVLEGLPQVLSARFLYGPLDILPLSGEKVDVYLKNDQPCSRSGQWQRVGSCFTNTNGWMHFPVEETRGVGAHPAKLVVRGDQSAADLTLIVLPRGGTRTVIFNIDGGIASGFPIMGKDPRVRPGAVDVARHWHSQGCLLLYLSARSALHQRKACGWMQQHNFPPGAMIYAEGITADSQRWKLNTLQTLIEKTELAVHCIYGVEKDVLVYQSIGLESQQIFVVGKSSRKCAEQATPLRSGYAAHLQSLTSRIPAAPFRGDGGSPLSPPLRGRPVTRTASYPANAGRPAVLAASNPRLVETRQGTPESGRGLSADPQTTGLRHRCTFK